jgi:hypothetical protein
MKILKPSLRHFNLPSRNGVQTSNDDNDDEDNDDNIV